MPENDKKKKKQEYTAHERRMYNQYVRQASRTGEENIEEMSTWIAKRRKKGEK